MIGPIRSMLFVPGTRHDRFAKAMNAVRDLGALLTLILREAARVVEADRCSLFILDRDTNELWSRVASKARESEESVYGYMRTKATGQQRLEALAAASDKLTADFGTWQPSWVTPRRPSRRLLRSGSTAPYVSILNWRPG